MRICTTVFLYAACAMAEASLAQAAADWNGTWIGNWQNGQGTQIIFAGNDFIGMYWNGDYLEDTRATLSAGDKVVTVAWPNSQAVITRDGDTAAHIVIHEKGKPDASFPLKKE
jgi:hypothetical protein